MERTMDRKNPPSDGETEWMQVAQRFYEPDGTGELTTEIVYAIAEARGVSPRDVKFPPLYECIDATAIEKALFGGIETGDTRRGSGTVKFQYTDHLVKVSSDGWITIFDQATP